MADLKLRKRKEQVPRLGTGVCKTMDFGLQTARNLDTKQWLSNHNLAKRLEKEIYNQERQ